MKPSVNCDFYFVMKSSHVSDRSRRRARPLLGLPYWAFPLVLSSRKRPLLNFLKDRQHFLNYKFDMTGADLGGVCRGCAPPPPPPRETTWGFLIQLVFCKKKKTMWFIGVEVEQETSATPRKKDPGSAPCCELISINRQHF